MSHPPNVLFILADQFRADCIGYSGNAVIRTPNLDKLAAEGVSFTHCFNQTAPCGPSRTCIFTGRYLCSHRAANNMTPLRDAEENLAQYLAQGGRQAGFIGYNDYAVDPAVLDDGDPRKSSLSYDNCLPGFDCVLYHEYDSEPYFQSLREKGYPEELLCHEQIHKPDVPPAGPGKHLAHYFPAKYKKQDSECRYLTERAMGYIDERSEGKSPWVLSLNYIKPHGPDINCEPYDRMYRDAVFPPPARDAGDLDPIHPYLRREAMGALQDAQHLHDQAATYYGMITELDQNLGLIIDKLKASGQYDHTLIIFSSDHGEYLGDHYRVGKGHLYDGAMRIPYIIRDPSAAADATRGQTLPNLIESIDSAPTILDFLGLPVPDRFQGRSLLPQLRGETFTPREQVFYEYDYRRSGDADPDEQLLWVVRSCDFKYVQFCDPRCPPLLFDLRADPGESTNLAADAAYASVMLDYCQRLLRWRMRNEDQRMEHWAMRQR